MKRLIQTARVISRLAHHGQKYGNGEDYFAYHINGVADEVALHWGPEHWAVAVALLHDTFEDTAVTANDLNQLGIPTRVIKAVETLTRREDEAYFSYVQRVKSEGTDVAISVKKADIEFNLAESQDHPKRLERYTKALAIIDGSLIVGTQSLEISWVSESGMLWMPWGNSQVEIGETVTLHRSNRTPMEFVISEINQETFTFPKHKVRTTLKCGPQS